MCRLRWRYRGGGHLLVVTTGTTERGHPYSRFVQSAQSIRMTSSRPETEDVPEEFANKLTEVDALLGSEVEGKFAAIPA